MGIIDVLKLTFADADSQRLFISTEVLSSATEQFVDALVPNKLHIPRIHQKSSKGDRADTECKVAVENVNAEQIDDEKMDGAKDDLMWNALSIQEALRKKQSLTATLDALLQRTAYLTSAETAAELEDGTFHAKFNKAQGKGAKSNLSGKLERMQSKERFQGQRAAELREKVEVKYLADERDRLQNELDAAHSARESAKESARDLQTALKRKAKRIRTMKEEHNAVVGGLRASLQDMATRQEALKEQTKEEKELLTQNLKQIIEALTAENQTLKEAMKAKSQPAT